MVIDVDTEKIDVHVGPGGFLIATTGGAARFTPTGFEVTGHSETSSLQGNCLSPQRCRRSQGYPPTAWDGFLSIQIPPVLDLPLLLSCPSLLSAITALIVEAAVIPTLA